MSGRSYKLFGATSTILALITSLVVYKAVSQMAYSEVREQATAEAQLIVAVTSGFVRTYSEYQAQLANGQLPNPAIFRADALHRAVQTDLDLVAGTSVVGLPGREIASVATDGQMRLQIAKLERSPNTEVMESEYKHGDQTTHRTLWPFFASEPACADCHNRLQNLNGNNRWHVGDLMGVQYVDQNISKALSKAGRNTLMVSLLVFMAVLALCYCGLFMYTQHQLKKDLQKRATTDSMTGCINRREMYARINSQNRRASGTLLLLDLDRFKLINDTHGHAVGDAVLKDFSTRIKAALRSTDWVARIGGEEFVVWLPDIKPATALLVAERLRREIELSPVVHGEATIHYTVSIGLHVVNNDPPSLLDSWLKAADVQLYRAKSKGRNCIVFEKEQMSASPA